MSRYHHTNITARNSIFDYKLVYKSGEIIENIPGTEIPFTIEKYKADLGVGYQNIHVYLMLHINEFSEEESDEDFPVFSSLSSSNNNEATNITRYVFLMWSVLHVP